MTRRETPRPGPAHLIAETRPLKPALLDRWSRIREQRLRSYFGELGFRGAATDALAAEIVEMDRARLGMPLLRLSRASDQAIFIEARSSESWAAQGEQPPSSLRISLRDAHINPVRSDGVHERFAEVGSRVDLFRLQGNLAQSIAALVQGEARYTVLRTQDGKKKRSAKLLPDAPHEGMVSLKAPTNGTVRAQIIGKDGCAIWFKPDGLGLGEVVFTYTPGGTNGGRCFFTDRTEVKVGTVLAELPAGKIHWDALALLAVTRVSTTPRRLLRRQVTEAMAELRNALPPDVVRAAQAGGEASMDTLSWVAQHPGISKWRVQAIEAYPFLAQSQAIIRPDLNQGPYERKRGTTGSANIVMSAIDGGAPRAPAIGQWLGLQHPAVDALRSLRSGELIRLADLSNGRIGGMMASLDPNHLPGRGQSTPPEEQWRHFLAVARSLDPYQRAEYLKIEHLTRSTPPWLAPPMASERAKAIGTKVGEARDAVQDIFVNLVAPVVCQAWRDAGGQGPAPKAAFPDASIPANHPLMDAVLGQRSLSSLLRMSELWHRARHELEGVTLNAGGGGYTQWPPLVERYEHGSISILPLTSIGHLRSEGAALHHCVGGYGDRCLSGISHILGVRAADGSHLSTAELVVRADGVQARVEVLQHRGMKNSTPPPGASRAVESLLQDIKTERIKLNPDAVAASLSAERRKADEGILGHGTLVNYDPNDTAAADAVFMAYRRFLPGRARMLHREDWIEHFGLLEVVAPFIEQVIDREPAQAPR